MVDTDALTGVDRRAIGTRLDAHRAEDRGAFRFVFQIALPWVGRKVRTIALGCVVAFGGCDAESVEVSGVVRDGRTGAPIAHARITTDGGESRESDEDGRFRAVAGSWVRASTPRHCEASAQAEGPTFTLRLFERLELSSERVEADFDAEVRLEVRTPCDADASLTWTQLTGPALGDRMRVEENGRVLTVRTHGLTGGSRGHPRHEYALQVSGELDGESIARTSRIVVFDRTVLQRRDGCVGAGCHDEVARAAPRWGHPPFDVTGSTSACAACHEDVPTDGWHHGGALACTACHDAQDPSRLRTSDVATIDGELVSHLGSGAVCASCHRAEVFAGRGARLVEPMDSGAHRFIVDSCVRCHADETHSFAIRVDGELRKSACTSCHGDVSPEAIGARDWDGDGSSGSVGEEHDRAVEVLSERLRARIAQARIVGACGRVAAGFAEHEGGVHLVDARGELLGDCDGSGRIEEHEKAVMANVLPEELADAVHDLVLVRSDGSRGVHNPVYTFAILSAIAHTLQ